MYSSIWRKSIKRKLHNYGTLNTRSPSRTEICNNISSIYKIKLIAQFHNSTYLHGMNIQINLCTYSSVYM